MTSASQADSAGSIPVTRSLAAVLGIGRSHAYETVRSGEWPTSIVRVAGASGRSPGRGAWRSAARLVPVGIDGGLIGTVLGHPHLP